MTLFVGVAERSLTRLVGYLSLLGSDPRKFGEGVRGNPFRGVTSRARDSDTTIGGFDADINVFYRLAVELGDDVSDLNELAGGWHQYSPWFFTMANSLSTSASS
jgi:hypothetical protein